MLLPQLRQHLTSVGDPELLRISRMIRAPPAVGLSLLWWVLTSCSVTFSQLRPSESNRDLYHGLRDHGMGPHRRGTPGLQCTEKTPLHKGFCSRNGLSRTASRSRSSMLRER